MAQKPEKMEMETIEVEGDFTPRPKLRLRSREPGAEPQKPLFEEPMPEMAYKGKRPQMLDDWEAMRADREKLDDGSNFRALLVGATPLLAGFLGGNMGDAYDIAGKQLVEEDARRQKEDKTLLDILKTQKLMDAKGKGKGGVGSEPNVSVYHPQDQKWYTVPISIAQTPDINPDEFRRYPESPKYEDPDLQASRRGKVVTQETEARKRAGLYEVPITGPEGQPMVRNKGDLTARPVDTGAGVLKSPGHRAATQSSVQAFQSQTKDVREAIDSAKKLKELGSMKIPEADSYLTFLLPKLAGSGQLSDDERRAFTGGVSIQDWVKMWSSRKTKGVFPPEIRARMIKLANLMAGRAEQKYGRIRKNYVSTQSKLLNLKPQDYEQMLQDDNSGEGEKAAPMSTKQRQARIQELKKKLGKE